MKKAKKGTLLILVSVIALLNAQTVVHAETLDSTYEEECCPFCDGDELTLKQKYEELVQKALIDNQNMLDDGEISKREYELQSEVFEKRLYTIKNETEEETLKNYKWILWYFFDQTTEFEAEGETIDKEFLQYIIDEMESYNVEM